MDLVPVCRSTLRTLNAIEVEKKRQYLINETVADIYRQVIESATSSPQFFYRYVLPQEYPANNSSPKGLHSFYRANLDDIIKRIIPLFPGCVVHEKILYGEEFWDITDVCKRGQVGISGTKAKHYIVVDWS